MIDPKVAALSQRFQQIKSERSEVASVWSQIAEHCYASQADFFTKKTSASSALYRHAKPDTTAEETLRTTAAKFTGSLFQGNWLGLTARHPVVQRDSSAQWYLHEVRDLIMDAFNSGGRDFYKSAQNVIRDQFTFGPGVQFIEERSLAGEVAFIHVPLKQICYSQDSYGKVDTFWREFSLSETDLKRRWKHLPEKLHNHSAYGSNGISNRFNVVHAIFRHDDLSLKHWYRGHSLTRQTISFDHGDKPWVSVFFLPDHCGRGQHAANFNPILEEGGYYEQPFFIPRMGADIDSPYGEGLGYMLLPESRQLNHQENQIALAMDKDINPSLLAYDEVAFSRRSSLPGSIVYGGVDRNGNQLVKPIQTNNRNLGFVVEYMEMRRQRMKRLGMEFTLSAPEDPRMTATQVTEIMADRVTAMAPITMIQEADWLNPAVERVLGILSRSGNLPEAPPILQDPELADVKLEYQSRFSQPDKATKAAGFMRAVTSGIELMQAMQDPSVMDRYDIDVGLDLVAQGSNAPVEAIRSDEAIAQLREQRAQQQQQQQAMENMASMAQGMKAAAEAGEIMEGRA